MSPGFWFVAGVLVLWEFLATWSSTKNWTINRRIRVCVGITVVAGAGLLWALSIPRVSVTARNHKAFITQTDQGAVYVRFSTKYDGGSKAICRAYINSLHDAISGTSIFEDFHFLLSAEDGGEPGILNGFTFYDGTERFFNLAFLLEGKLFVAAKTWRDITSEPLKPGTYKAKVEINGDNCGPLFQDISFKYAEDGSISFVSQ